MAKLNALLLYNRKTIQKVSAIKSLQYYDTSESTILFTLNNVLIVGVKILATGDGGSTSVYINDNLWYESERMSSMDYTDGIPFYINVDENYESPFENVLKNNISGVRTNYPIFAQKCVAKFYHKAYNSSGAAAVIAYIQL